MWKGAGEKLGCIFYKGKEREKKNQNLWSSLPGQGLKRTEISDKVFELFAEITEN